MRHAIEPGTFTFAAGRSSTNAARNTQQVTLDGERTDYERRNIVATTSHIT